MVGVVRMTRGYSVNPTFQDLYLGLYSRDDNNHHRGKPKQAIIVNRKI